MIANVAVCAYLWSKLVSSYCGKNVIFAEIETQQNHYQHGLDVLEVSFLFAILLKAQCY